MDQHELCAEIRGSIDEIADLLDKLRRIEHYAPRVEDLTAEHRLLTAKESGWAAHMVELVRLILEDLRSQVCGI